MKKLSARLSFGLLTLLATGFALFYGLKVRQLEAVIEKGETLKRQSEAQRAAQKELRGIDSVLLKGAYEDALRAYEAKSQQMAITDGASIEMRVALVKELLRLYVKFCNEEKTN